MSRYAALSSAEMKDANGKVHYLYPGLLSLLLRLASLRAAAEGGEGRCPHAPLPTLHIHLAHVTLLTLHTHLIILTSIHTEVFSHRHPIKSANP